ncbi:MAG: L-serine ammonia-lyase, iron-sulfur-dependent, subunit alpha [Firmicutes bacterium]|nr:L-serine ammonia-lyase, iron-sulfur-dependent, subunit alpha [Bacillota bacterium]
MDFINGESLLALCAGENMTISQAMLHREMTLGETTREAVYEKLARSIQIMKDSTHDPIENPVPSMGGLLGGESKAVWQSAFGAKSAQPALCGTTLSKAIAYAMAVLEVNASMGLIVAAPTAGSSGVIPGTILSICEDYGLGEDAIYEGILNASAVGYIIMRNASVSGAEAGCQAEVGAASAMAASAAAQLLGGSPQVCLQAASLALSNLLGLVCDPIAGLVESPCQSRNAIGVSNAFTSAQLALAGVKHPIPFDEMVDAMYKVGLSLPFELRETALGGCAGTPTGCQLCSSCMK